MASVNPYLNFAGNTEEAFLFYQSVFGGEFIGGISRFGEIPASEGMPPMPEEARNLVMHIALPIVGNCILMGSDAPPSMGFQVTHGNSVYICLSPDSRSQTEELFAKLAVDGKIEQPLQDMFWGALYGSLRDRFGLHWMFNYSEPKEG